MSKRILLDHGSGGEQMQNLISEIFYSSFNNEYICQKDDSAVLPDSLVFTTDSFVINPLFFNGGDIGKLSICGTVNDLAVCGAKPLYLASAFIIEEGFEFDKLKKIVESMANEAKKAGVLIVAGDTKVVKKGDADGLFITTSGVGRLVKKMSVNNIKISDAILVNGTLGDHAMSIMASRTGIDIKSNLKSDCCCLNHMIDALIKSGIDVKFMRDATRGGLSAVLNEIVQDKDFSIEIDDHLIPYSNEARTISELLGIDLLQSACEGRVVIVVANEDAEEAINIMKNYEEGKNACLIGTVNSDFKSKVVVKTYGGGKRVLAMPSGELLPRIC